MGSEDDFLLEDEDDEKTVEFIKNYLPQDLKDKFTDDDLYYILDLIVEYYTTWVRTIRKMYSSWYRAKWSMATSWVKWNNLLTIKELKKVYRFIGTPFSVVCPS